MHQNQEQQEEVIKSLKRQNQLITDKNENVQKAYEDLQKQLEQLMESKAAEIYKIKKEAESQVSKEKERCTGLEKQFKRAL